MKDFSFLEKELGLEFKNKDLLIQSFTHKSYLNENPDFNLSDNERLEFLGDAILEHIVTEYLYIKYPEKPEGELTSLRASLVNSRMLSKIAQSLGFDNFLLLSQGETKENNRSRQYILADTFEAFVGSLYLDQGLKICKDFIKNHLITELTDIIKEGSYKDAKSLFQEKAQEKYSITPTYEVLKELGPDHIKEFVVGVYLGKDLIAQGQGLSKQEAEEEAAEKALEIKIKK